MHHHLYALHHPPKKIGDGTKVPVDGLRPGTSVTPMRFGVKARRLNTNKDTTIIIPECLNPVEKRPVDINPAMELAGDDAFRYGVGLEAEVSGENRLSELLENGELEKACLLLQSSISAGNEANCWLAQNSGSAAPYGNTGSPNGETVTVHHLLAIESNSWTVTLDVWSRGGNS